MTTTRPLAIVGGGPAGIAAATEAARAGLPGTLIDESPRLGGQIYRQPPREFNILEPKALGKDCERGLRLRKAFGAVSDHVEILNGTSVLGVWSGREILFSSESGSGRLVAERLILATGAYDRPVPFPGWTLPGVMTAGGAQVLAKSMRVRPGQRALVAGTGPLLLVVANQLHKIGVKVVAVLEAGRHPLWPRFLAKAWREWSLLNDAFDYWLGLRRAGIPILFNHTIFEVQGDNKAEVATYGPLDPATWKPIRAQARQVEIDLVVVGFGLVPNTELTELAGCRHRYAHEMGGWIPVRDARMETTVPDVLAVGDGAGIRGAQVAVVEGRIAGITAAEQAGLLRHSEADRRRAPFIARLKSLQGVREVLDEMSRIRPGLSQLATPETIVCRCEEVALAEVDAALAAGARDLQAVKLFTRLGMGPCQGRNCAPAMGPYICHAIGRAPEQVGRINPRPPVKPVTLGALARSTVTVKADNPVQATSDQAVP